MPDDAAVEALIEDCVKAGVAARRAYAALLALDARQPKASSSELKRARAESDRLSKAYVNCQGPLAAAEPALFHARFAEVQHRINERLK